MNQDKINIKIMELLSALTIISLIVGAVVDNNWIKVIGFGLFYFFLDMLIDRKIENNIEQKLKSLKKEQEFNDVKNFEFFQDKLKHIKPEAQLDGYENDIGRFLRSQESAEKIMEDFHKK